MGGYAMPNAPGSLGKVMMADDYNRVTWELQKSTLVFFGGSGTDGFLALNGSPLQPTSLSSEIGYRFRSPEYFFITKLSYDAEFAGDTSLEIDANGNIAQVPLDVSGFQNLNLSVGLQDIVTIRIASGSVIKAVITLAMTWFYNAG